MITGIAIGAFIGVPMGMLIETLCIMAGSENRREEREKKNDESGIY